MPDLTRCGILLFNYARTKNPFSQHPEVKLPYEESEESFNRWFRETLGEEWTLFLNEDQGKDRERYDALKSFLYKNGTQEEINTYLKALRKKGEGVVAMNVEEWLVKERPDLKFV